MIVTVIIQIEDEIGVSEAVKNIRENLTDALGHCPYSASIVFCDVEHPPHSLMKFVYKDNSKGQWKVCKSMKWIAPVVFECEAETISQADDLYAQNIGKNVTKQVHIGMVTQLVE